MLDNDPTVLKKKQSVIDVGQRTQLDLLHGEVRRNKEVLTKMRLENTQLNIALQQAIRGKRRVAGDEYFRNEEEQLHNKLCVLKRSLNSVRGKKEELTQEIQRTIEETNYIIKEGDATIDESSALGQKIRALENRLDKCLIKHNEVNAIRRTYETLLERLQQEQSGFDTRLAAMEKTLQNKDKDLADLSSVASEAAAGRDAAKAEVLSLKTQLSRERREHKKDIEERKAFVATKRAQLEKASRRLHEKMEKDEERRMRARLALSATQKKKVRVNPQKQLQPEELERQQQLREAYNRLKEVTMSSHVGEVVFKLKERQDANTQLMSTAKEAEAKNAELLDERRELNDEWNDMQQQCGGVNRLLKSKGTEEEHEARGTSVAHVVEQRALVRRRVLEEFDSHLRDRQNELEEARVEQEFLGQMLVDVDTGVHHLAETLESINSIDDHNGKKGSTPSVRAIAPRISDAVGGISIRRGDSDILRASSVITVPRDSAEFTANAVARGNMITDLLRACGTALQRMLEELQDGDVEATAKCLAHWRGALPASNIRVRLEAQGPRPNVAETDPHALDKSNEYNILLDTWTDYSHPGAYDDDGNDVDERERDGGRHLSGEDPAMMGRKWLGAAARSDPADDFPENEIHDRRELKMMSLATVERERKKAKKQQQQRSKDETA